MLVVDVQDQLIFGVQFSIALETIEAAPIHPLVAFSGFETLMTSIAFRANELECLSRDLLLKGKSQYDSPPN